MRSNNYPMQRANVFREVLNECGLFFEWYRIATIEEIEATGAYIIVEETIPENVLWERLAQD